jgi:hypothetical protein
MSGVRDIFSPGVRGYTDSRGNVNLDLMANDLVAWCKIAGLTEEQTLAKIRKSWAEVRVTLTTKGNT